MIRRALAALAALVAFALLAAPFPARAAAVYTSVVASQVYAASGVTPKFGMSTAEDLALVIEVTSVTGTSPTLDLWLQVSLDGGTTWADYPADVTLVTSSNASVGTETVASSTGSRDVINALNSISGTTQFVGTYRHVAAGSYRVKWIISGTFSAGQGFTFSAATSTK